MEDKEFEGEWLERVLLEGEGLEGKGVTYNIFTYMNAADLHNLFYETTLRLVLLTLP